MEESMFSERSTLMRNGDADRKWADELGEEPSAVGKIVAVLASVVIAVGAMLALAMPYALLHIR
jgi:hypothetical protein